MADSIAGLERGLVNLPAVLQIALLVSVIDALAFQVVDHQLAGTVYQDSLWLRDAVWAPFGGVVLTAIYRCLYFRARASGAIPATSDTAKLIGLCILWTVIYYTTDAALSAAMSGITRAYVIGHPNWQWEETPWWVFSGPRRFTKLVHMTTTAVFIYLMSVAALGQRRLLSITTSRGGWRLVVLMGIAVTLGYTADDAMGVVCDWAGFYEDWLQHPYLRRHDLAAAFAYHVAGDLLALPYMLVPACIAAEGVRRLLGPTVLAQLDSDKARNAEVEI